MVSIANYVDNDHAASDLDSLLYGIAQSFFYPWPQYHPVDHNFYVVALLAYQFRGLVNLHNTSIDARAHEAATRHPCKLSFKFSFPAVHDRSENLQT